MKPDHGKIVAEFLLRSIENEIPRTTGIFEALPADRLDYKPDALSKTALALMRHIALEDVWFLESIAAGSFGAIARRLGRLRPDEGAGLRRALSADDGGGDREGSRAVG